MANAATVDADNIDDTMHTMQGVSTRPMQELFGEVWRSGKCAEKYTNRLGRVSQNLVMGF